MMRHCTARSLSLLLAGPSLALAQAAPDQAFVATGGMRTVAAATAAGSTEFWAPSVTPAGTSMVAFGLQQGAVQLLWSSPPQPMQSGVVDLLVGDLAPQQPGPEVVAVFADGTVQTWSRQQRRLLLSAPVPVTQPVTGAALGDVDRDGRLDLAVLTATRLLVLAGDPLRSWAIDAPGGGKLAIGQIDGDAQLELVCGDGRVVDGLTRAVQFDWHAGFGPELTLADIDGDGFDELITVDSGSAWVWAFDLDVGLPKWTLPLPERPVAVLVADQDGDGAPELIVKGEQWGSTRSFDARTLVQEWAVPAPVSSMARGGLAAGDLDGDGQLEVAIVTDYDLHVIDGATRSLTTPSRNLHGFLPPRLGDLDGDGLDELVSAVDDDFARQSELLVLDPATLQLQQQVQPGPAFDHVLDLALGNLDADAAAEVLAVTGSRLLVYDCSPGHVWSQAASIPYSGTAVLARIADVDPSPGNEILLLTRTNLQVLAYPAGNELWHTLPTGTTPIDLQIADADGDQDPDLLVGNDQGVVFAFDAASHALWGTLQAPAGRRLTSFTVPVPGLLLVGDDLGGVSLALPSTPGFALLGPLPLASAAIDRLQALPGLPWLVLASGGELRLQNGLQPAWRGSAPDPQACRRFLLDLARPGLCSVGANGIYRFQPR